MCNESMGTTRKDYQQESKTDEDANMDLEHLHPKINHLGDYGINHGKYETDNGHCDDLHNDVPQNRDNPKEIIIHCLVWNTRKMLVHNWKLTGTYYLMKFGLTLS